MARKPSSMGIGPCDWQPPEFMDVDYPELRSEDREVYAHFGRRAALELHWARVEGYQPEAAEPAHRKLQDAEVSHFHRGDGELRVLVDRVWFGFPDPLQYSLVVIDSASGRGRDLGQFWNLPPTWQLA